MIQDDFRHQGLRRRLVDELERKGIHNTDVLAAISRVPRHVFFDPALISHAYQDKAFPIGQGQTISQPYTVAFQTQLLEIEPGHKVLEIGTGSGYQAAILAEMQAKVYSIERYAALHRKAREMLDLMGHRTVRLYVGDGTEGLPRLAPFDRILVTAGAPEIPLTLIDQLAPGGIMVIPVGDRGTQEMMRVHKDAEGQTRRESLGQFKFVPLIGAQGWAR